MSASPPVGPVNRWRCIAGVYGRLVAQGVMARDEALASLLAAGAERMPRMAACGRDMRLAWALDDAVAAWRMGRDRTRFALRRALAPMLAERAPSARLLAVARSINLDAGGALLEREVLDEVRREVYWAARRQQPQQARRRA